MTCLHLGERRDIVVAYTDENDAPTDPLTPLGLDSANITAVSMNLKRDTANDADDAYLEHTLLDGGVLHDSVEHTFTFRVTSDDYGGLAVGRYELVLAVTVAGVPGPMIELGISDPVVDVVSDRQRA